MNVTDQDATRLRAFWAPLDKQLRPGTVVLCLNPTKPRVYVGVIKGLTSPTTFEVQMGYPHGDYSTARMFSLRPQHHPRGVSVRNVDPRLVFPCPTSMYEQDHIQMVRSPVDTVQFMLDLDDQFSRTKLKLDTAVTLLSFQHVKK